MNASKFSDARKAFILKEDAGGMAVADIRDNVQNLSHFRD